MDFFSHQENARRNTSRLVGLYALAVAGIIASVYLVFVVMLASTADEGVPVGWWHPGLFAGVAVAVSGVVFAGSFFKTMQLSKGGSVVAESLGGRPVAPDTRDANERKLLNVVEEMALAAGIAVPRVYLLEHEPGINAFAAGFSTRDAVIGVTRGCMEALSRDELQGVIAHEFSHIVNGDMRLNIRLMGILFGILMLTLVGQVLFRSGLIAGGGRSRDGKKQGINPLIFIGLALIVIGYIGVFFANLIKSAISRQREYLSDASAVQFTRHPAGIAGALKKIGGLSSGARVQNAHASEASHMFFGPVGRLSFAALFSTHPPLAERIKRLDPAFNPAIAAAMQGGTRGPAASPAGLTSGFAADRAGSMNIQAAASAIGSLPASLHTAVHDPLGARAVIYGLLWSRDGRVQAIQQQAADTGDPAAARHLKTLRPLLADLPPAATRLPLAELAIPALRLMPAEDYHRFKRTVNALTAADREIDLFEFALSHMIIRHVESAFGRSGTAPVRHRSIAAVRPACIEVLAGLAIWGTNRPEDAATSFNAGWKALGQPPPALPASVSLDGVSRALKVLCEASPSVKREVIGACTACILADGRVASEQAELLRAVADALDVPMPPLQPPTA